MREIVVGQISAQQGVSTINVWFRFPVPAQRQNYYTTHQQTNGPQAPGDYTATSGVDFAEVAQLSSGAWIERPGFQDIIDPTNGTTLVQTRLQNIYAAAASSAGSADTSGLAFWASSWTGGTAVWSMKSA